MNREQILQMVTDILRDILQQPSLVITEQTTADTVERWDSINHVNILMTVERTFKIRFSLGEIKQLRNVGEMVALVEKKIVKA
jgi:acyl carrier protein